MDADVVVAESKYSMCALIFEGNAAMRNCCEATPSMIMTNAGRMMAMLSVPQLWRDAQLLGPCEVASLLHRGLAVASATTLADAYEHHRRDAQRTASRESRRRSVLWRALAESGVLVRDED